MTPAPSPSPTSAPGPGWWLFLTGVVARATGQPTPAPSPGVATPDETVSPWWWLVVAIIVVGLVVGGVLLWRRRRTRTTWDDELGHAATELRWANDQLLPGMLAALTAAEFQQAWTGGRPRILAADQELYALSRRAPDETRAAPVAELRTAIAGLLRAVDTEAGLTSPDPDALRSARAEVERARSALTAAIDAAEGKPAAPQVPAARP